MTNPYKAIFISAVILLTGCSDAENKEKAITFFMKSCKQPVSMTMTLSQWNNSVTMTCAEFKPEISVEFK